MIGVEGQYRLIFTIADQKDFLAEEQLVAFKIIEDVSNALPTFELVMDVWEEKILKYLNEGNIVKISMGLNQNDLSDSFFYPTGVYPTKQGENKYRVRLVGIYAKLPYITDKKVFISTKKNSVDAIKEIASKYFTFSTNVKTSDPMCWIQPNITDRSFVNHIWQHSYIDGSFPAIGITIAGDFKYMDVKKLATEGYKYRFTNKIEDKAKDILHDGNYRVNNASTFLNQTSGYGKTKLVSNLEEGTFTTLTQDPAVPTLALSSKVMRNKDIMPRYDEHSYQSLDNVHQNFWKAKLQNQINLNAFGQVKVSLFFFKEFKNIKVLDVVFFKEEENLKERKYASETVTGLYLVTKVSRIVKEKGFQTYVEISREAPNSFRDTPKANQ